MKEFPELEALPSSTHAPVATFKGGSREPFLYGYCVPVLVDLYNELREAYLALQGACKLRPVVDAAAEQALDPRLSGERRVPTEPGLYLAQTEGYRGLGAQSYDAFVDVYGSPPYLRCRLASFDLGGALEVSESGYALFGPRLAGPEWRKIAEEVER